VVFGGFRVFLRFLCFGHLLRHPFRSSLQLERSICAAPDAVRVNHHAWCPSGAVDETDQRPVNWAHDSNINGDPR